MRKIEGEIEGLICFWFYDLGVCGAGKIFFAGLKSKSPKNLR